MQKKGGGGGGIKGERVEKHLEKKGKTDKLCRGFAFKKK